MQRDNKSSLLTVGPFFEIELADDHFLTKVKELSKVRNRHKDHKSKPVWLAFMVLLSCATMTKKEQRTMTSNHQKDLI